MVVGLELSLWHVGEIWKGKGRAVGPGEWLRTDVGKEEVGREEQETTY